MRTVGLKLLINLFFVYLSSNNRAICDSGGHWEPYLISSKQKQCLKNTPKQLLKFVQWDFASDQILVNSFPVDTLRQNYVREVQNVLFSRVYPKPLKEIPLLAAVSDDVVTNIMDLNPIHINGTKFTNFASGNLVLPGTEPLSHRYGGHQFGYWAGQLGDGRAIMIGEYVNWKGERWELQLKGSGVTPYSRRGDGRAVIRSSVREFLCSEAMHALGIPTSRAASLVVSSDKVIRDQFYNGNVKTEQAAVVLRLARSWFRFGSLEILADNKEISLLRNLTDFIIVNYFPNINSTDNDRHLQLFQDVVLQTADMIALWQSVGFTHGVCNTDNFSILSITIDYGPFGFMEGYNPKFIPNTSDDEGRYSYENQPDVGLYNLQKLKIALHSLSTQHQIKQLDLILKGYESRYKSKFMELFCKKLGIKECSSDDENLVAILLTMMEETQADFTMTFRELSEIDIETLVQYATTGKISEKFWSLKKLTKHRWFSDWCNIYTKHFTDNKSGDERCKTMKKNNPKYILRNWIAQQAIEKTEKYDFSEVRFVLNVLQNPFEDNEEANKKGFASEPPMWAKSLRVSCSS